MADTGVVETLLRLIEKADDGVDSLEVANSLGLDHQLIVGAVKSLQAVGDVSLPGCSVAEVPLCVSICMTDAIRLSGLKSQDCQTHMG